VYGLTGLSKGGQQPLAGLGAWGSRSPTGCHQGVSWGYSQLKALLWERSTSELTHVALARFSSSWAVGLKSSAPRWLLAGGCPQFLAIIELEIYSQNGSLLPGQGSEKEQDSLCARWTPQSLCNLISEMTSITFFLFIRSESLGPALTRWEGL